MLGFQSILVGFNRFSQNHQKQPLVALGRAARCKGNHSLLASWATAKGTGAFFSNEDFLKRHGIMCKYIYIYMDVFNMLQKVPYMMYIYIYTISTSLQPLKPAFNTLTLASLEPKVTKGSIKFYGLYAPKS